MSLLAYIDKRLAQLRKDKASPLVVSEGERELMKLREFLIGVVVGKRGR